MKFVFTKGRCTAMEASVMAALTYGLFSLCDSMGKWLQAGGYDFSQILVLTNVPSFLILSAILWKKRGFRNLYATHYPLMHIVRAAGLVGVTFFLFKALAVLPLADFYGIVFSTPFLITIGAVIFFREKTSLADWIAIAIGFVGVLIVAQPSFDHINIGYLYALGQATCITIAALSVRKIGGDEDPFIFVVFGNLGIIAANLYPALTTPFAMPDTVQAVVMICYALCIPTAILLMSATFAKAPSVTNIMPFQYTQIFWGALIGWLVFGNIPTTNVIIGSGLVISCGLYILFHTHRKSKKAKHHAISTREAYFEHQREDSV